MQPASKARHLVSTSASIPTPPARAYAVFADYHIGHPRILPEQFSGMTVERGGVGAGTVIRCDIRVLGRKHTFHAPITEPEPGRVLMETCTDGTVTTVTVDAGPSARESRVTIATQFLVRRGFLGSIERFLLTRSMRPIYDRELALLTAYVAAEPREFAKTAAQRS